MKPLIAGNWKMHGAPDWYDYPSRFNALLPENDRKALDILMCPPALFIESLVRKSSELNIHVGAQNCHAETSGAHTGEISTEMLKSVGARFVIVGHSERRADGEMDADILAKALAAIRGGITPIVCVGETLLERESGHANNVVTAQLVASLGGVDLTTGPEIVVAYEPVWAIGTGMTATPDDIVAMHARIRAYVGPKIRILYGGSVKPNNAKEILKAPNVNGALIGGASLDMDSFAAIAKAAL